MSKPRSPSVDLGQAQLSLQTATNNLRLAQRTKEKADIEYVRALELHEHTKREFNAALVVVQTASRVPDPYAS